MFIVLLIQNLWYNYFPGDNIRTPNHQVASLKTFILKIFSNILKLCFHIKLLQILPHIPNPYIHFPNLIILARSCFQVFWNYVFGLLQTCSLFLCPNISIAHCSFIIRLYKNSLLFFVANFSLPLCISLERKGFLLAQFP